MRGIGTARRAALVTLATLAAVTLDVAPAAAAAGTERISVATGGTQGDADIISEFPGGNASDDGRYVVFDSFATNLVAGDTNDELDVFVRDRQAGTTERVSVTSGGVQGDSTSGQSAISGNGRFVVFTSLAGNLVPGDTNGFPDVFLHDRQTGVTERVSVAAGGAQGTDFSVLATVSDDGNRVAFMSNAPNLVAGDTNDVIDVFVRDRQAATTVRVNVSSGGTQADSYGLQPAISGSGDHVAFYSEAGNLVPGDTNAQPDFFVHDLQTATTERVSVATGGGQGTGQSLGRAALSDDGRYIAFRSDASDLVAADTNDAADVFVRDRQAGTTARVSLTGGGGEAGGHSSAPTISDDGRRVAFQSEASDLVAADTNGVPDVFVRDRQAGTTERVSLTDGGGQGDGDSDDGFISGDGRHVTFASHAANLVAGDTNGFRDVFVRDLAVPGDQGCVVTGTSGDDVLTGTGAGDVICGLGGDDVINGGGGDDTLVGGAGNDRINGGGGDDTIDGGTGADHVAGGGGDDTVDGGPGNDSLKGQGGDDVLTDRSGVDIVSGESGDDRVDVQDGSAGDTAAGGSGADICAIDAGDFLANC
ncbi:hypothetical protein ACTI_67960 [Actinoplanes sp. OR16]|uniref:PD40 domain-containing protein n=1 Tax=Actinoplanes sp. OR16 TaxID=946334 RepID=UPI000F6DB420|nr:PD40 domain-containing protein [Actinoplanes sp. OR16]BBH70111.1 hypothetical protein ACTI_67960 [Actinoplanes sp. OR16]